MSYQVLARKWRPRNFPEMVGQEHVLRALINALDNDRLHHAFLFTGTRGVGKTTVARIFAKSLNCETGVSSQPCGECSACREIDEGRFIDLIEVDAASRTKVEDTRELMDNVQYAPTRGRYKVYLIDEVHMLSTHSFNALLKTLEEPPPHVKFLLATTDPQKLPVTILSRCLQFNLKRLPVPLIAGHLEKLLGAESVPFEGPALNLLARAADGSMRDALSLLDQAIAFGNGTVSDAEVRAMLGSIEQDHVFELVEALAARDAAGLLSRVDQLAQHTPDFANVLAELLSLLHRVALGQQVTDAIDDALGDRERVMALAGRMTPEEVQLYYQIGLIGRRDLPLAPDARGGLEMVLLRMLAFHPAEAGASAGHGGGGGGAARPAAPARPVAGGGAAAREILGAAEPESPRRSSGQRPATPPAPRPMQATAAVEAPTPPAAPPPPPAVAFDEAGDWGATVAQLGLRGAAQQLALNCVFGGREGEAVTLLLDPQHVHLRIAGAEERLREALGRHFGSAVRLQFRSKAGGGEGGETPAQRDARHRHERQQAAERAILEDPNVQSFQEVLGARVQRDAIQPLDEPAAANPNTIH
ncbi:DNA polymerase III subunit gamma/tau [Endothiovibrio diazotrophicus]